MRPTLAATASQRAIQKVLEGSSRLDLRLLGQRHRLPDRGQSVAFHDMRAGIVAVFRVVDAWSLIDDTHGGKDTAWQIARARRIDPPITTPHHEDIWELPKDVVEELEARDV